MAKDIHQTEMERVQTQLEPILDDHLRSISPLVQHPQLCLMAVLIRQAARFASQIGMPRELFEKRVMQMADVAYAPRIEVPKIVI
jgi:hypothetical protein